MSLPAPYTWARMTPEERVEAVLRWFEPTPAPGDLLALRRDALRRAWLQLDVATSDAAEIAHGRRPG